MQWNLRQFLARLSFPALAGHISCTFSNNSNPSVWKKIWSQQYSWQLWYQFNWNVSWETGTPNLKNLSVLSLLCPHPFSFSYFSSMFLFVPLWVTTSSFCHIRGQEGQPCIRWCSQCCTRLTHHPNNRGWPWAALPINHLTLASRKWLPFLCLPPPSFSPILQFELTQGGRENLCCFSCLRGSKTVVHHSAWLPV